MGMATLTIDEQEEQLAAQYELAEAESCESLPKFLQHVVIDAAPEPMAWGLCWEWWQAEIINMIAPGIEAVAGLRENYTGPRSFFIVLPKGHDKTGLIGRLANWAIAFSKRIIRGTAAASTMEQAGFLLDSMTAEIRLNPWLARRLDPQNYVIHGLRDGEKTGSKLKVISADADHSSGLRSDVYIMDELTFWASRDLFDALYVSKGKRPGAVVIIITNAGIKGSWQEQELDKARAAPNTWGVYETPECVTLASWISPDDIADMRRHVSPQRARRVIDNKWIDVTERPLLPYELQQTCFAECLWPDGEQPAGFRGDLYIGIDLGFTRDRSVVWTFELLGDVAWTRSVFVMAGVAAAEQKREIKRRLTRQVVAARIDMGAQGWQIARELESEHPRIVEAVALGSAKQGQLAAAMKSAFERHRIRIPNAPDIVHDFQLVEEVDIGASGGPSLKVNRDATGHADRFWGAALALYGMPLDTRRPNVSGLRPGRRILV